MSAQRLGSRAVIGEFFKRLEQDTGAAWVPALSMEFDSDQESEEYAWLGQTPGMREWIGGRNAKGFRDQGITVRNKHYEATLEVLLRQLRRDKSGQVLVRIGEMAQRANAHWASLLSTLMVNGESTVCYDGQFFFDTDHSEGDSGTQSNDISVDISALPTAVHGITTAPSVEEFQLAVVKGVQQVLSFVDDQGEPMNENARSFVVKVPIAFWHTAVAALVNPIIDASQTSIRDVLTDFTIRPVANARLSSWTTKFAVCRADGSVKPFIRQAETGVMLKVKAEGSDFEFDNDAHQYGIDTWRNVAYGYWQHACLVTLT